MVESRQYLDVLSPQRCPLYDQSIKSRAGSSISVPLDQTLFSAVSPLYGTVDDLSRPSRLMEVGGTIEKGSLFWEPGVMPGDRDELVRVYGESDGVGMSVRRPGEACPYDRRPKGYQVRGRSG